MCQILDVRHRVPLCFLLVHLCAVLGSTAHARAVSTATVDPPALVTDESVRVTWWPVVLDGTDGRIEVYQPQPEAMKGDTLTARAAVSLTPSAAAAPLFGAVWFTARVAIDRDTRTVAIRQVTIDDVRLPGATATEQQDFSRAIGDQLTAAEITFPLDQLTTSLDTARREQIAAKNIETTPPHILFSTTPATLISIQGEPRLQPVEGQHGVSRVVNTPFILLLDDDAGGRYYLKAGPRWVSAADLSGTWADTAAVPPRIAAAGADLATAATQSPDAAGASTAVEPAGGVSTPTATATAAPAAVEIAPAAAEARIIVATQPTELIVTTGNPQFTPLPGSTGGEFLYASNTASDLFLDQLDKRYYVLLSGRWFTAGSLQDVWQYVPSAQLPPAFAMIPPNSPKADVLPFVAGTTEAREALLDASIPQTTSIRRDAGATLSVAYDGDPRFQSVPESPGVSYALNTPEDVLRVNGRYYCCHQAVWYESAEPTGPWTVCVLVPQAIYTLPPSCPDYHVQYVYVYDAQPDYVTTGYLPGYTGTFVDGPTIVYGTGYTYPGWFGTAYFAGPCTWGFGAYFDPFAAAWGFDVGLFWGGAGWFAHPEHERWWRDHPGQNWGSHRWWGPSGFVGSHEIRDHLVDARSGHVVSGVGHAAGLTARLPGSDHRGPGWNNLYVRDGNAGRNLPAAQVRHFTPARVATEPRDNVFAGSDGRVFRRSPAGWEAREGAGPAWSGVERVPEAHPTWRPMPNATPFGGSFARPEAGLDQHFAARSVGAFRSATVQSFSGGAARGGGVARGGGGRR